MFESWLEISIVLALCILFGSFGYLLRNITSARTVKKLDDEVRSRALSIAAILADIETATGIPHQENSSPIATLLVLQNILMRASAISVGLRRPLIQRSTIKIRTTERQEDATPASEITEVGRQQDEADWNAFYAYTKESGLDQDLHQPNVQTRLAALYNDATQRRELRDEFWREFQITPIENVNAVDQRLGNTVQPDFRQSDSGNFYAIYNPVAENFLVVPKFDFTVKPTNYENTIKFVFSCGDFDESLSYSRVEVLHPAVFVKTGDAWKLDREGALLLIH